MPIVPVIAGPTAGGKSALAVEAALRLGHADAEGRTPIIISADAFAIYRGMDIGTGKPTLDERRGVEHRLIDEVGVEQGFSVSRWLERAREEIAGSIARRASVGSVPAIVVGGTHLYIKALLDGLFDGPGADAALRAELAAWPRDQLRAELERIDPASAARLHANDLRRTIRAIEVFRLTGRAISDQQTQWDRPACGGASPGPEGEATYRLFILDWSSEGINRRINARVRAMFDAGLVAEVRRLAGAMGRQAREALGYRQVLDHLDGRLSLDEAIERTKIQTRRLAKSQRTWLRRLRTTPGATVLAPERQSLEDMAGAIARVASA